MQVGLLAGSVGTLGGRRDRPAPHRRAEARQGPPDGEDSFSEGFSCKTLEGGNSA
jgi:hypothetical protein